MQWFIAIHIQEHNFNALTNKQVATLLPLVSQEKF